MSLARGEGQIRVVARERSALPAESPAIVIAVAASASERLRIADAVGDVAPVLLVTSLHEAVALLAAAAGGPAALPDADPGEPPRRLPHEPVGPELYGVPDLPPADGADGLRIDSDARVVVSGELWTDLSPIEHDLLLSLHRAGGHIRTFDWLQRNVWHNDHQGGRSHVQSAVKRLRRKLRAIGSPLQIDAVRGVGLRLVHADGSGVQGS